MEQKPRLTSAVLVEDKARFLLAKRNKENYNSYWVIPGGGVNFGESIEEAALREIKEETNLDVEITKLIGHKEVINVPGQYHSIIFFHLAKPKNKNIKPSDDVSDARFFSIEEIKKIDKLAESAKWVFEQLNLLD